MMARYGIVLPKDIEETNYIASWCWKEYNLQPMKMDASIGIIDSTDNNLVGAALFYNWNGPNVELNLYTDAVEQRITPGLFRSLAFIALRHFNVIRVTIRTATHNTSIIRNALKFGFEHEGIEKNFYGFDRDCVRMVLHRAGIEKIAGPRAKLN